MLKHPGHIQVHLDFNSKHCGLRAPAETDLDFLGHAATPLRVQTPLPRVGSYPPLPAMSTRCSLCSPPVLGLTVPWQAKRAGLWRVYPCPAMAEQMIPVSVCLGPWAVVPMSEVYRPFLHTTKPSRQNGLSESFILRCLPQNQAFYRSSGKPSLKKCPLLFTQTGLPWWLSH